MKFEQKLPIGLAKELERKKRTAEAVRVENEVWWVNRQIEFPFKLEEGEPCDLALLIDFAKQSKKLGKKTYPLEVSSEHRRTAILGRVIFKDKQGRLYRDIDLKGAGLCSGPPQEVEYYETGPEGLADRDYIANDQENSEKFLEMGIRTYRYIAIINLKEILGKDGQPISIEEAKRQGLIGKKRIPVIGVRAWATRSRVTDSHRALGDLKIADAKRLICSEIGQDPKKFKDQDYLEWFAKTLGKQVALIHKNGLRHQYLTWHNITLDCRIVDLDSADKLSKDPEKKEDQLDWDISCALSTLGDIRAAVISVFWGKVQKKLDKIFKISYQKTLRKKIKFPD